MTKWVNRQAMSWVVGFVAMCGFAPAGAPNDPAPASALRPTTATIRAIDMSSRPRPTPRPDFTSRPILAIGTIESIDSATSSVLLLIDRDRSSLPNILRVRARKAGLEQMLLNRELPPARRYTITPRTLFLDTRATTPTLPADRSQGKKIDLSNFRPGEWVSVLYRMRRNPDLQPALFNMSKVDPNRTFEVDYNPFGMGARPSFIRRDPRVDRPTTASIQRMNPAAEDSTTQTRH